MSAQKPNPCGLMLAGSAAVGPPCSGPAMHGARPTPVQHSLPGSWKSEACSWRTCCLGGSTGRVEHAVRQVLFLGHASGACGTARPEACWLTCRTMWLRRALWRSRRLMRSTITLLMASFWRVRAPMSAPAQLLPSAADQATRLKLSPEPSRSSHSEHRQRGGAAFTGGPCIPSVRRGGVQHAQAACGASLAPGANGWWGAHRSAA